MREPPARVIMTNMGVDILYYVDHDLPTDCAESFLAEFNKRAGADGKWRIIGGWADGSLEKQFPNPGGDIHIYKIDGDTIEEALALNSTFEEPCAVLKNDEAFGHSKDLRQPIYVFDL